MMMAKRDGNSVTHSHQDQQLRYSISWSLATNQVKSIFMSFISGSGAWRFLQCPALHARDHSAQENMPCA